MPLRNESDDIHVALVGELARIGLPNGIMGVTLVGVGLFAAHALGDTVLLAATLVGGLASAGKLGLIVRHLRRNAQGPLARHEAVRWERGHILTTAVIAASVGVLTGRLFAQADLQMQMLATGLLFGYCSGVVTHLSIRPRMAAAALLLATLPPIGAAAWSEGRPHHILAAMFALFLVGALQSVLSAYRTAIRQIRLRLDMAALARSDALTGLANRLGLRRAFGSLPATDGAAVAVHCFDLDGFKLVNDRYGHAVGDALLQELGARLQRLVVAPAVVARVGGDEFVVLQPSVQHPREAEILARRIAHTLEAPYQLAGQTVSVGLSLGYASAPSASANLDDLLRRADAASYAVKRRGGGVAVGAAAGETGALLAVAEVA
ncbi:GGDEF domain-containing protein [Methylobacterium terricola]|uniref:GGDEF domain-containing protein n=1 Tax=Methylobacterium terricola TaxID=2583531 RepID=A0A5C4LIV1_9HYPH|nr:GGDEF domain-containing protein [Methylobacterium terricola]TNC14151.1 GGDEF domain-containing protein [Methylobacterium terricola]